MTDNPSPDDPPKQPTEHELEVAEERGELRSPVIFYAVRQRGAEELLRPNSSLMWSGIAAGIAISTSIFAMGFLRHALGDTPGAEAIAPLGYSVGFLIVILARLQLFTENTITITLPLFTEFSMPDLWNTARVWALVFLANMIGTFLVAALTIFVGITSLEKTEPALAISRHLAENNAWENLRFGIPAGFLIAALVWINANAESARFWMITVVTYVIALGGFTHVVAGSTEYFLVLLNGDIGVFQAIVVGILPTLVGNVIGGTGLFAFIAYAQVKEEL